MRKGTILLATMSEFGTIDAVMQEISESVNGLERFGWALKVLVVDDGNDPNFHELCTKLGRNYGLETQVVSGPGAGLGSAILDGFGRCLEDPNVEVIINLDADGQHDARQIGDLLRAHTTTNADITIGSRWTRGGRCYGLTFSRKILSRTSATFLHLAGVPGHVKDPTTSFRVYGRSAAQAMQRDLVGFNGFSFFGATIAVAAARDLTVIETPIHFRPRLSGNSNLRLAQIRRAVRDLPSIRSMRKQIVRRQSGFLDAEHGDAGPDQYNARRELELLSNTPRSTEIIIDELGPHLGRRIVEVGAGLGQITGLLTSRGYAVTAIEPDPTLFSKSNEDPSIGADVRYCGTLGEYLDGHPSEVESFDTALYINVLEHIEDDVHEVTSAARSLRPGGSLVIFVPALPALYGTMDEVSGHYRRYRKPELRAVIERAGLEITDIHHFDPVGVLPYWLAYAILRRKTLDAGSVKLYDTVIIPTSKMLSRLTRRKIVGKNLIVVGRKP